MHGGALHCTLPERSLPELIATSGSGVSATVALLVLERIGVHAEVEHDGSFNEWSADPSRPAEYARAARTGPVTQLS